MRLPVDRFAIPVIVAGMLFGAAATVYASPIVGQTDNFQDGTTLSWGGGDILTTPTGGPLGATDIYLQLASNGGGPGGVLATYNFDATRWAGNYTTAGVDGIAIDLLEPASNTRSPLQIRILLFSSTFVSKWVSVTPFTINNDGAWHHAVFSLAAAGMTEVAGTDSYASVLSNVGRLQVRYDMTPTSGGTPYAGTLGIDNVTALPEPGATIPALTAAAAALLKRNRRRIKTSLPKPRLRCGILTP